MGSPSPTQIEDVVQLHFSLYLVDTHCKKEDRMPSRGMQQQQREFALEEKEFFFRHSEIDKVVNLRAEIRVAS